MPKLLRDVPSFIICLLQKRNINIKVSKLGQRSSGAKYVNSLKHSIKMGKCTIFAAVFHNKNTKEVLSCLFV